MARMSERTRGEQLRGWWWTGWSQKTTKGQSHDHLIFCVTPACQYGTETLALTELRVTTVRKQLGTKNSKSRKGRQEKNGVVKRRDGSAEELDRLGADYSGQDTHTWWRVTDYRRERQSYVRRAGGDEGGQGPPSKHAYVGPTLAQRLQLRWINVARQRWINVVLLIGPTVALPLAPTICQPSANVDPTLAQRNSIWNYVGSTLIQRNLVHHYVGPSLDQRWSNVMQYVITLGHHWANADPT